MAEFKSWVFYQAGTGVILPEDTSVAALECKHVIIQSLDEVKGNCHLDNWASHSFVVCLSI